jgi:capsid protein
MGIIDFLFGNKIKKSVNDGVKQKLNNAVNKALIKNQKIGAAYGGGQYYNFTGSRAGGEKWSYGLSSSGAVRILDHYALRQNARDLFHDSLDARAIIERMTDSIVDTGMILESTPDAEILGITPEEAEIWSTNVEKRFHLWALDKKQHRAGMMNFYQSQRLYGIMQQRDNDNFVRLYYSNKKTLQNPLQYGFFDANQIRGTAYTNTYFQNNYEDGIIRNPDGTEKAYKVWVSIPGKPYQYKDKDIPRIGPKSGKIMMIHGFNPEYAGQGRGYARLGFAIQEMENLTDFTSAAIKKAINQSNLVMSVENQQKDPGNPLAGITNPMASAIGSSIDTSAQTTTDELIDSFVQPTVCPIPEAGLDTPGSVAFVGNEQGDTIRILETKAPADDFKSFIDVFTSRLSAAVGISQEAVLMKFSANYSASRATLLLMWRVVNMWREEMSVDFLNPIYKMWLGEEIAAGRISAPGFQNPILQAAWLNNRWIGAPLPSIDPAKEAKARKENLEMNLTTLERESRNLNGTDAKSNITKNTKTFNIMPSPPWGSGNNQDNTDDDNDDMETIDQNENGE